VLARILAKSASYLGWLGLPLELIDLPPLSNRLTVHGVLEPFDHGFKVRNASLQVLETLRYRLVPSGGIGRDARWLSARAELNHHAFQRLR
jgi:hypothetical protein